MRMFALLKYQLLITCKVWCIEAADHAKQSYAVSTFWGINANCLQTLEGGKSQLFGKL